MEKTITVRCRNNGQQYEVDLGSNLADFYAQTGLDLPHGPISASVNNKVEGMHYRLYKPKDVEFLDITSASGLRIYTRTLFFVLCKISIPPVRCRLTFLCPTATMSI